MQLVFFSKVEVPKQKSWSSWWIISLVFLKSLPMLMAAWLQKWTMICSASRLKWRHLWKCKKKAVIATEDENFETHNGWCLRHVLRATLGSVVGVGSSSGVQLLLSSWLSSRWWVMHRPSSEAAGDCWCAGFGALHVKDDILTTYLNVSPFGRNNSGQISLVWKSCSREFWCLC